jgi:hypothetical protein
VNKIRIGLPNNDYISVSIVCECEGKKGREDKSPVVLNGSIELKVGAEPKIVTCHECDSQYSVYFDGYYTNVIQSRISRFARCFVCKGTVNRQGEVPVLFDGLISPHGVCDNSFHRK